MNLVEVEQLNFRRAGATPPESLTFSIRPGLTFVRGGEGRGKSTLLRLMAGEVRPGSGAVRLSAETTFLESPADSIHDSIVAAAWLDAVRLGFPDWDAVEAAALIDAFGLSEHIDKPMYMLSTGSRRKVGLVGAAAGRAHLTLLDTPFSALDAASSRVLARLLRESAMCDRRAWVLADYDLHPLLAGIRLSGLVDLGE